MNAVQFCDQCPTPPYDGAENVWRIERMKIIVAKIGHDASQIHERGGLALEYVWLTNPQQYNLNYPKGYDLKDAETRFRIAQYMRDYVMAHELDGLFLDCPLDYPDIRAALQMVYALKDAMPDKILMPNFGSFDAWELTARFGRWAAFAELRAQTDWHFVQVALHTRDGWDTRLHTCVDTLGRMLEQEKRVVVGIDDRPESAVSSIGPHRPDLAAALAYALPRHSHVYAYYQNNVQPARGAHVREYGWCDTLEKMR